MLFTRSIRYIFDKLPIRLRCLIQAVWWKGSITLGAGSYIHSSVHLLGKANIRIGANSCVSEGGWLNVNHRKKDKLAINIGSNCFIGKQNFFTSGDVIILRDFTLTTIGCKFIGSSHNIANPEVPYLSTGTTCSDRIEIGVNCFIGAGTTVLGNVNVGHGSVIGADSLVMHDIPPFSIAIGNPARVIKRYSFDQKDWIPIAEISFKDEVAMPNEEEYLAQLKLKFPIINMPWIAAAKSMGDL
jgi:acetyltransferase-like isoleucine patch superfamily enzyme